MSTNEIIRLVRPLLEIYKVWGAKPPALNRVEREDIPAPYHDLLAHDEMLQPHLEAYHGMQMQIHILKRHVAGPALLRHYALGLKTPSGAQPEQVARAVGVSKVDLSLIPHTLQPALLNGDLSLSTILKNENFHFHSCPKAFLRFKSGEMLNRLFGLPKSTILYGRSNLIYDASWHVIADHVEILPPLQPKLKPAKI